MSDPKNKPLAQDAYDALAEVYAEKIDTKPHNAYYERPAMISLLPEVDGRHVLDAGCGPGVYTEWLVKHGALVVAFDANPKMVRLARQRVGETARVIQANLEEPLDFLQDGAFDIVLCPLAMDYVKEWEPTFGEFFRVLKPAGLLLFSMEHPYTKYDDHRDTSNYFNVERVEYTWRGFGTPVTVPSYRRPLESVVDAVVRAGFILEKILEPKPTPEFEQSDPEEYAELMRSPGFMCVRARKGLK